jgi:VanZ family protein
VNSQPQKLANPWWLAIAAWLGVIAFSSTSAAAFDSERAFYSVSSVLFRYVHLNYTEYRMIHFLAEKWVHVTMFMVLAILLWKAIPQRPRKVGIILLVGAVVGSCSELLQSLFPDRDPAIRDVLINIGGTALGIAICLAISRWHRRRVLRKRTPLEPVYERSVR